jgi:hypothetical protein
MKTVFQTNEVAHIWAQQKQATGRNSGGNIYFNGAAIYSYGSHFCMGKFLPNGIVLLTNRTYSNTTAKHLSGVRYAVNHLQRVYCAYPDGSIEKNLKAFEGQMKTQHEIITAPRKRPQTKQAAILAMGAIADNIDAYLAAMGTTFPNGFDELPLFYEFAKSQNIETLQTGLSNINEVRTERQRLAALKQEKEAKERRIKWLKGENVSIYSEGHVYLRAKDGYIETSKGAKVAIQEARILFDRIAQGKDVKGFEIGSYTVISMNGVLTIGCHKIERKEINRLSKKLGWGVL